MAVTISEGRPPALMGASEVASELGILVSNIRYVRGLPAPIAELDCGRIWDAEQVRTFARSRTERVETPEPEWVGVARALKAQGMSFEKVAEQVGKGVATVHRHLKAGE